MSNLRCQRCLAPTETLARVSAPALSQSVCMRCLRSLAEWMADTPPPGARYHAGSSTARPDPK